MTESKPEREPRALSTEYHKARKQLMLWAGILFIWELVGIDLEKAKEAGGNAGAIIGAIKSPQAVPWTLLILVLYFAFKLRLEWGQCNRARRDVRESKLDYLSAFVVAGAAVVLYIGQTISHIQFANAVQGSSGLNSLLIGAASVAAVSSFVYFLWERFTIHKTRSRDDLIFIAFGFLVLMLVGPFMLLRRGRPQWTYLLIGLGIGLLIYIPLLYWLVRKQRKYYGREKTS